MITARRKWGLMGNRYINDIFLKAVFYRVNHCGITKDTISHARSRQGLRPVGARACRPIVNAYKLYIFVSRANFDKANMIFYIVNLHRRTVFQTRYSFNAFHIFISRIIDIYISNNQEHFFEILEKTNSVYVK